MEKQWIALFSQSGSEIKELSTILGRKPDLVLTNNKNTKQYCDNVEAVYMSHEEIMQYLRTFNQNCFITLHGYLRIIPADVCERHEIINGHPGLITMYPELKGKDPQERITLSMSLIGSVCHEVTAGVDEGPVITESVIENTGNDYYNNLRKTSLDAWRKYFEEKRDYT